MNRLSTKQCFGQLRLSAASAAGWQEWPATPDNTTTEESARHLGPGEEGRVALVITSKQPVVIVMRFASDFHQAPSGLGLCVHEQPVTVLQNPDFPKLAWGQLDEATIGLLASAPLTVQNKNLTDRMAIKEILVLPVRKNRLNSWWLGLVGKLFPFSERIVLKAQLASFPYCYFNAYQYYNRYPDAACQMKRFNCANLAEYYCRKGRAAGHEIPLCYDHRPSLGTLSDVLRWAAKNAKRMSKIPRESIQLENDRLRRQLDQSLLLRGFDTGADLLAIQLENDRLRRQLDHLTDIASPRSSG